MPFTKYLSYDVKIQKWVLETGSSIIQTGNGIIFPSYIQLIKNFPLWKFLRFEVQKIKLVLETGNRIIQTGNGIILLTDWIMSFTKVISYNVNIPKQISGTRKSIFQTGNVISLLASRHVGENDILQKFFKIMNRFETNFRNRK